MVHYQGTSKNPENMSVAMLAIPTCQVCSCRGEAYWAYLPDPPMASPASWESPSIPVFTNDTWVLGGCSASRISPTLHGGFNHTGLSATSTCFSSTEETGCLLLQQENQTAYEGSKIAIIVGPWDIGKYIQTVSKWGFPNVSRVVPQQHAPLSYCPYQAHIEIRGFSPWCA